jgi:hypothetical protein
MQPVSQRFRSRNDKIFRTSYLRLGKRKINNLFATRGRGNVRPIYAGIAQLVEQLICNSRKSLCARFHCVARCR